MNIQDTNPDDVDYTVDKFVKQAAITKSTLYQWIRQGLISPGTKLNGKERRWKQADLMDVSFIKEMRNEASSGLVYDGQLANRTVWKWSYLGACSISTLQKAMETWAKYQQGYSVDEAHHENLLLARDLQGSAGRGTPHLAAVFTALRIPSKTYITSGGEEVDLSDPASRSDILSHALEMVVFGESLLPAITAKHPNDLFSDLGRLSAESADQAKRRKDQKKFLAALSVWLPQSTDFLDILLKNIPSISRQSWEYARYCCLRHMADEQRQKQQSFLLTSLHNTACETLFFWLALTLNQQPVKVPLIELEQIDAQRTLRLTIPVQRHGKSERVSLDLLLPES